jgi:TonB-dependent receptor
MIQLIKSFRLSISAILLFTATQLDSATIEGTVLDSESGSYLEGVEVLVEGTSLYRYTKRGGNFDFRGLDAGTYNLIFRYSTFPDTRRTVVLNNEESREFVAQRLTRGDIFELEAFTVEGTISGQAKAFSQKKASSNIREIIASDSFGQFVDRNAAEALQRVAGISVEDSQGEGKFIIIRGADPSLNTIAIDGVVAATPEEDGRSTGLNIISIDQLERIEVDKTWLPNNWANFVGGAVNLVTRSALDREGPFATLQSGIGRYNSTSEDSYRSSATYGNAWGETLRFGIQLSLDWSEDNRGSDTLSIGGWDPTALPELRFPPEGFVPDNMSLEDYQITRERNGSSAKIELEIDRRHRWSATVSYNQFDDTEVLQDTLLNNSTSPNDYSGPITLTEERAILLGYDLNDPEVADRVYGSGLLQRRMTFEESQMLGYIDYDAERLMYTLTTYLGSASKDLRTTVTNDEILTYQLMGSHKFGESLSIDYLGYVSEATKNWNAKTLRFDGSGDFLVEMQGGLPIVSETGVIQRLSKPEGFRISDDDGSIQNNFYDSEDRRSGGEFNAEWQSTFAGLPVTTRLGAALDQREKQFTRDFNRYSRLDVGDFGVLRMDDLSFYGGELRNFLPALEIYSFGPKFDVAFSNDFIDNPGDVEFLQTDDDRTAAITDAILRNYAATEDIHAFYLMQTWRWNKWELVVGARWEETENTFTTNRVITQRENLSEEIQAVLPPSFQFIQPRFWASLFNNFGEDSVVRSVTNERTYDNLLYAAHLKRTLWEDWVLQLAITRTLARPKYTDLVPREIVSISGARYNSSARLPNFALDPMISQNYDLSLSHYFKSFGVATVSVFYKDLDGPIYDEIRTLEGADEQAMALTNQYYSNPLDQPEWSTSVMKNAGDGKLYGLEISVEKRFTELPGWWSGFGLAANASWIDSEVALLAEERLGEVVPLFLQSDQLANVSIFYDRSNWLIKLSWNFRGKYLDNSILAGTDIDFIEDKLGLKASALDRWIDDFERLDLLVEYRPLPWMVLYVEGTNILDEPLRQYLGDSTRLRSLRYTEPAYFAGLRISF